MRQGFGEQHRGTKRARDWDDRPPPEPQLRGPWEHLPAVALAAALFGIAAGASLIASDRVRYDRLMVGAGLTAPDPGLSSIPRR